MKVFLICVDVDLGYHVESVYSNNDLALEVCKNLNTKHKNEQIASLISIGYSAETASAITRDIFFIEEHEVEE